MLINKQNDQVNKAKVVLAIIALLILGAGAIAANQFISKISSKTGLTFPKHSIINPNAQFEGLWAISDLIISSNFVTGDLVASGGKAVLVLPTEDTKISFTLRGMDIATGQVIWEVRDKINGTLAYNSSHIFAGAGFTNIVAYDIEPGSVVWETSLPSRNMAHMVATESELYVEGTPAYSYQLDPNSGVIINSNPSMESK
jgi:outer membrane protein assembly factor BamB